MNWVVATGQWAHRWLACIAPSENPKAFTALPDPKAIRARVREGARRFRADVTELMSKVGRTLPEWWVSGWRNANYLAERFAERVAQVQGWSHLATEWSLPQDAFPLLADDSSSLVFLTGRIDLLLAKMSSPSGKLPYSDFWIVDYKTGNRKGLVPKKLVRGTGIQLALYGLALRALGASRADMSILTRAIDLDQPQLTLQNIKDEAEIWRALAQMARSGVFGMRGELRAEFAFHNDYPLATLAIDQDLLEDKWAATYPELVPPNES